MNTFELLNEAITKRNMCRRSARRSPHFVLADGCTWDGWAEHWERQAAKHAETLDTRLVPLPGAVEDIITAELFLRLAGEETE